MLRFLESITPIFIAAATGTLLLSILFLVVLNSRKSKEFSTDSKDQMTVKKLWITVIVCAISIAVNGGYKIALKTATATNETHELDTIVAENNLSPEVYATLDEDCVKYYNFLGYEEYPYLVRKDSPAATESYDPFQEYRRDT